MVQASEANKELGGRIKEVLPPAINVLCVPTCADIQALMFSVASSQ